MGCGWECLTWPIMAVLGARWEWSMRDLLAMDAGILRGMEQLIFLTLLTCAE